MEKKMIHTVIISVAIALVLTFGAIAVFAFPYTATCPADGGTAMLDSNSCSTTGVHVVCMYIHHPDTGPAHSFYVQVQ